MIYDIKRHLIIFFLYIIFVNNIIIYTKRVIIYTYKKKKKTYAFTPHIDRCIYLRSSKIKTLLANKHFSWSFWQNVRHASHLISHSKFHITMGLISCQYVYNIKIGPPVLVCFTLHRIF